MLLHYQEVSDLFNCKCLFIYILYSIAHGIIQDKIHICQVLMHLHATFLYISKAVVTHTPLLNWPGDNGSISYHA